MSGLIWHRHTPSAPRDSSPETWALGLGIPWWTNAGPIWAVFFGGVGCIHWQNMPTPCLRGRFLPRFWPTRCVGFVRRLRGSYAVLFGADLFFLFADEWGLLGLHFFHFELLGIHFLSFWLFGPVRLSFPFILAFWVFISFHCHFGVAQVCTSTGCGCHHIQ